MSGPMAGEGGAPQRALVLRTPPDEEHHRLEVVVRKGGAGDLLQHRACADQSADTHAQRATAGVSRRAAVEKRPGRAEGGRWRLASRAARAGQRRFSQGALDAPHGSLLVASASLRSSSEPAIIVDAC